MIAEAARISKLREAPGLEVRRGSGITRADRWERLHAAERLSAGCWFSDAPKGFRPILDRGKYRLNGKISVIRKFKRVATRQPNLVSDKTFWIKLG